MKDENTKDWSGIIEIIVFFSVIFTIQWFLNYVLEQFKLPLISYWETFGGLLFLKFVIRGGFVVKN